MLTVISHVHSSIARAKWKKRSEETQTLHAGCSKAETKIVPPQIPFPQVHDGQNLISWRWSLPLPTSPVWWGSMHTISSYHGNRPTHTHTHQPTQPPTHKQDRLHACNPSTQCNYYLSPVCSCSDPTNWEIFQSVNYEPTWCLSWAKRIEARWNLPSGFRGSIVMARSTVPIASFKRFNACWTWQFQLHQRVSEWVGFNVLINTL